jgi:hypothetical protein
MSTKSGSTPIRPKTIMMGQSPMVAAKVNLDLPTGRGSPLSRGFFAIFALSILTAHIHSPETTLSPLA